MVSFGHFLLIEGDQFWLVEAIRELISFQMDFESIRHDFFDPKKLLVEWDYCSEKLFSKYVFMFSDFTNKTSKKYY